ncbi:MAG: methionyl-tRNA formyltransferase [Nitrospirae bacterium]|nr:methionyl-tRNA formyltransferase [Nitrospirota bacterium]MBF0535793.1 methionyl-tRNA formyltransferase [Nitrospirota bacterium]MBF0617666.1 methionyl-tRNA formyltransferase [Nitrospirota bacterium]
MNIAYFGNGLRGVKCLLSLCEAGFKPAAVVVEPNKMGNDSVFSTAQQLGISTYVPQNVNSIEFISDMRSLSLDLMILSGYTKILKKDILAIPTRGTINLHGGKLPEYRGGSPINWQVINGELSGGCAVLYVDEGIDTGDIIEQRLYPIAPDETAGEIINKTLDIFQEILVNAVTQIASNTVRALKQDPQEGTYYCKRYPDDGRILWDRMSASDVHNLVRGLNGKGLPGAFTFLNGTKIVLWKTVLLERKIVSVPGNITLKHSNGVVVMCKDRCILITEIKKDGFDDVLKTSEMPFSFFARKTFDS